MKHIRFRRWLALPAVFFASAVFAQDSNPQERGVARISLINGDVSVRRGDTDDWVAGAINAPLVVGDRVATGATSRAEVQFDYANMIRLSSNSEVRLTELEAQRYQLQVARGLVTFRVLRDSGVDVDLSTPTVSVRPVKKGIYRVAVRDDGQTEVTVRSGEAEIYTPRGVERLQSGKTMLARGTAADPEFQVVGAVAKDDWDNWSEKRDRTLSNSRSYEYVSRDIYGAEDLDAHGRWVYVAPYGWVWAPSVPVGWAPYRQGRWSWMDYYGWSWVSYEPWGWAPYHYGRWFHHGPHGWCWYPGVMHARHHWSPGLVAFFGWNSWNGFSAGVGIGFGHVGWVPLAPYEPYHAWWGGHHYGGHRSNTYVDNSVRIVNNVNITNVYRNARVNNGVTAVGVDDFTRGRSGNYLRAGDEQFRRASVMQGQVPVAPRAESVRMSERDVRRDSIPRTGDNMAFYSRRQPAQVERVSFEQQRRSMEQISQRAFSGSGSDGAGGPVSRSEAASGLRNRTEQSGPAGRSGGWRSVNEPAVGGASQDRGWRRFGEPVAPRSEDTARSLDRSTRSPRVERDATSTSGWRGFDPSVETQTPSTSRSRIGGGASGRVERQSESPSFGRQVDRGWRGSRSSGESIQLSPPMVRERATPRVDRSDRSMSGSSGGVAPRSEGSAAPRGDRGNAGRSGGGQVGRSR